MNVFQRRAQQRDSENFSNSIPTHDEVVEEETNQPNQNIFQQQAAKNQQKEEEKFSFLDTARDIGEQVISKGISGFGGAYGNLLDTMGLQGKEGEQTPGEQARNDRQFQVLEKMNRGEAPTMEELMSLSDEDYLSATRLPTSKEVQKGVKAVTGIGEGKTAAGRIAGRGTEFVSEGMAYPGGGLKALVGLGASGIAGQSIREAGGSESLASGVEIGGSIIPSILEGKLVPRGSAAQDIVDAGRAIGLTEKQITPLIQGEKKVAALSKVARKGSKTKELFASIKESLGDSYSNIKKSVSTLGNVNAKNRQILLDKFTAIKTDLQKTLKASPDKEAAIKFIEGAIDKVSKNGASPEELINFWQDINKSVKWNSIQGGKKSLTKLKEPILEVLNNVAPQAAKDFEMTNQLYSKYAQISKKLKPDIIDSVINKGELLAVGPAAISFISGNPWALTTIATEAAVRTLGREMLINPYFQNLATKLVKNFNQGSLKAVTESVKQAKEFLQRKYPEEDWGFLTEG